MPERMLRSPAYAGLRRSHLKLRELAGHPPYEVTLGRRHREPTTFEGLRAAILDLAKDGSNISRFKGLGEMNPDQLWETTMNPETRTLQRVTLDDAQAADEIFTHADGRQGRAAPRLHRAARPRRQVPRHVTGSRLGTS